jgi:DNA-binding IclR family transcriptional regulator
MLSRMPRPTGLAIYRRSIALGELTEAEFPRDALQARLDQMRQQDFASTRASDYVRPTAHWAGGMISMLVPTPVNHRVLAIGIGGPAKRLDANMTEIVGHLRAEMARLRASG